jgi:hypothetical protein
MDKRLNPLVQSSRLHSLIILYNFQEELIVQLPLLIILFMLCQFKLLLAMMQLINDVKAIGSTIGTIKIMNTVDFPILDTIAFIDFIFDQTLSVLVISLSTHRRSSLYNTYANILSRK